METPVGGDAAGSPAAAIAIDDDLLREWPLPVPEGGDKENRGRVLLIGGSPEIAGAAVLAATAALRAGAGKVTIGAPASIAQSIAFAVPESRVIALDESANGGFTANAAAALDVLAGKVRCVLIGPGLAYDTSTRDLTGAVLEMFRDVPTILDAGAMTIASGSRPARMRFSSPVVLTPHAGEMASLSGSDKEDVVKDAADVALGAARAWNACVVLKGAITYIAAPNGRIWRHEGGNIGLATSGSGDVLSGIIAGLAARGTPLEQASAWGVALHARAGVRLADRFGTLGYLARELPGEVPALMAAFAG